MKIILMIDRSSVKWKIYIKKKKKEGKSKQSIFSIKKNQKIIDLPLL
jgi:hypothetical protein